MPIHRRLTLRHYLIATFFACLTLVWAIRQADARGFTNLDERYGDWYLGLAENLVLGNGYRDCAPAPESHRCDPARVFLPSAYRLPGYPVYLAANLLVFGMDQPVIAIRLLQCVLVAMITYVSALLAARYVGSLGAGLTGFILVHNHHLLEQANYIFTEILFTLLLVVFVVVLVNAASRRSYLAAGFILGAVMLTRGSLIFLLPLLIFVIPRRWWMIFAIGLALLILPWTIRNYVVLDAFVPFSTGSGAVLWGANNPVMFGQQPPPEGTTWSPWWREGVPLGSWANMPELPRNDELIGLGEVELDRTMQRFALEYLATVPLDLLIRAEIAKLLALFGLSYPFINVYPVLQITAATGVSVLVVSIFDHQFRSTLSRLLASRLFRITLAIFLAFLANTAVFYGSLRFRLPFDPFFAVWSGVGIALMLQAVRWGVLFSRLPVIVGAAAVIATVVIVPLVVELNAKAGVTEIHEQVGEAELSFTIERRQMDCTFAEWRVVGIREIYLNGAPDVGERAAEFCGVPSLTWHVVFRDGTERDYELASAPTVTAVVQGILQPHQRQLESTIRNPATYVVLIACLCLLSLPLHRGSTTPVATRQTHQLPSA